jgi:hypothetical protein
MATRNKKSIKAKPDNKKSIVKVAGHWDLGWNTPIKEIDLWEYPMRDFGVDVHYMCPISGIDHKVEERNNIEQVLEENPDLTVIFCDERAETLLSDFAHPQKALYIFGRANFSPFLSLKRKQDLSLKIETVTPEGGLLWGHQAAAIILYDRYLKQQN